MAPRTKTTLKRKTATRAATAKSPAKRSASTMSRGKAGTRKR